MSHIIQKAFSLWEETHLISLRRDWRDFDPGIILTDENVGKCRTLVEKSRFVFIVAIPGFTTLSRICPKRKEFSRWARGLRIIPFINGTRYTEKYLYEDEETGEILCVRQNEEYNRLMDEMGIKTRFAPPDLFHLVPKDTILLFPPIVYPKKPKKPRKILIAHSPGTKDKRIQKGTRHIEKTIAALQKKFDFNYQTIMGRRKHKECLALKAPAHIFIDQIPPILRHSGLGKSGLESLAFASVVLSAWRWPEQCGKFFEPPPILPVYERQGLLSLLETLLDMPRWMLDEWGKKSRQWAKKHIAMGSWLEYMGQYV